MPKLNKGERCIQIHHNREFHWVVSQQVYAQSVVNLFDSLDHGARGELTSSLELQLSAIYGHQAKGQRLTFNDQQDQQKEGGSGCGLFPVAVATELCFGDDPNATPFNQAGLQNHLKNCFQQMKINPFPKFCENAKTVGVRAAQQ